jgi:hypothetical protein
MRTLSRDRGAIIIHVAFALMALLAFTAFVVDYGVMWVARRQAQNVADAAALAGAISLVRDGGSEARAIAAAQHYAANNPVWGQANSSANVEVALSKGGVDIPPCGENPGCVRVDVFRNMPDRTGNLRGDPIPTFFAHMLGISDQGVRATATAEVQAGNQIRCLLPFAVADRWSDATDTPPQTYANDGLHLPPDNNPIGGWSPNDLFDTAPGNDTYVPPYHPGHTGWTVAGDANRPGDYGRQLVLKDGKVGQFSAGWSNLVDLPNSVGGCDLLTNIRGCNETPVGIAKESEDCSGFGGSGTTPEQAARGCIGIQTGLTNGPTQKGVEDNGGCDHDNLNIVAQDPGAVWDPDITGLGPAGTVGGVVDAAGNPNMASPRIRPVAIFDINHYFANGCQNNNGGTGCSVKVANIIGFFVEGMCETVKKAGRLAPGMDCGPKGDKEVVGRIVTLPSTFATGAGNVTEDAAFLKMVRLVR